MIHFCKTTILSLLLLLELCPAYASVLPKSRPIYIELQCYDKVRWRPKDVSQYHIWVKDIYTKENRFLYGEIVTHNNYACFEFEAYQPVFDVIRTSNGGCIPFYAEPGDSLVIEITSDGKPLLYRNTDRTPYAYNNFLLHDISNSSLYDATQFDDDKHRYGFTDFSNCILTKVADVEKKINEMADKMEFTSRERALSLCNAKLQLLLWIFEYTNFKSHELSEFSKDRDSGWRSIDSQESEVAAMRDRANYGFLRMLPLNDSICMSSRFFDMFINGYENSEILKQDQYLYFGVTDVDSARMDSALIATDRAISGLDSTSLFMDIVLQRRHMVIPEDYGFFLKDVKVYARRNPDAAERLAKASIMSAEEIHNMLSFHVPQGFNVGALIFHGIKKLFGDKKAKAKAKRQKILDSLEKNSIY